MNRHSPLPKPSRWPLLAIALLAIVPGLRAAPAETGDSLPSKANVPDAELLNQDGHKVRLRTDLMKDRVTVLSFIFTSCPTICTTIGVNVGQLRKELGASLKRDVTLISISIDPVTDTPEKLKAWGKALGAGEGWSLLTGNKDTVTQLLKKLEAYSPDIQSHSPFLLVVNDRTGQWQRVNALEVAPAKIAFLVNEEVKKGRSGAQVTVSDAFPSAIATNDSTPASPAQRYFTDVKLKNQDGKELRLYSDLLKGNVVVIDCFFSGCTGVCKVTMPLFQKLQQRYADAAGKKPRFISISVDPETDTPDSLRKLAAGLGAKPGWDFLTGDRQSVDLALRKLGFATETKEGHSNVFLVGNERTGLWKKVLGIGSPEEIAAAVESVLTDAQ
jgi:protein SCO1/2